MKSERYFYRELERIYVIIILEGFDESGKSALAQKLAERLPGFKVVHPGKRPFDADDALRMADIQSGLFHFAEHVNLIMDRVTCISSNCYTWHTTSLFARHQIQIMESKHIKVIHCLHKGAPLTVSEHDRDGSVGIARKNKDQIIERYNELFKGIEHCEYDYTDRESFYKVAKYIGFDNFDKTP